MILNATYESFSLEPEYVEANRKFLERQSLSQVQRILDLACGNGSISEMLLQAAPQAHLNGLDQDPVQIGLVIKRFENLGYTVRESFQLNDEFIDSKPILAFAVSSADRPPFPDQSFDCVVIANAIHLMPDKEQFIKAAWKILKPGGIFGFNSAFYAGTFPEGTHQFYTEWLKQTTTYIQTLSERLQAAGQPPIRRIRDKHRKAFRNRWYSPAEWSALLEQQGFQVTDQNERVVLLNGRCFAAIGAYAGFAEVLLQGYPVDAATEALQSTAHSALAALNITTVPRNWLEMWAIKR
ncbi:MAG: class I SAM-dependent methyltransferase [Gammaproteobacteria bacterium]|nr:class I SAM-dependent methyltransferase [Gammaproteobacteria bacterium]